MLEPKPPEELLPPNPPKLGTAVEPKPPAPNGALKEGTALAPAVTGAPKLIAAGLGALAVVVAPKLKPLAKGLLGAEVAGAAAGAAAAGALKTNGFGTGAAAGVNVTAETARPAPGKEKFANGEAAGALLASTGAGTTLLT